VEYSSRDLAPALIARTMVDNTKGEGIARGTHPRARARRTRRPIEISLELAASNSEPRFFIVRNRSRDRDPVIRGGEGSRSQYSHHTESIRISPYSPV